MKDFSVAFDQTSGGAFPLTTGKNSSGGGALDGTHFTAAFISEWWGFAQACLSQGGLTPSGTIDVHDASQILDGVIAKVLSDASSDDIDNDSDVTGATVTAALDSLDILINALSSDAVANDSSVSGVDVTAALNTLKGMWDALSSDEIPNDSTVTGSTVTDALNNLDGGKKDNFTENSAFNKDFGTGNDDVARGDHRHETNIDTSYSLFLTNNGGYVDGDTVSGGDGSFIYHTEIDVGDQKRDIFGADICLYTGDGISKTNIIHAYITDNDNKVVTIGDCYSMTVLISCGEFDASQTLLIRTSLFLSPRGWTDRLTSGSRWAIINPDGTDFLLTHNKFNIYGFSLTTPL